MLSVVYIKEEPEDLAFVEVEPDVDSLLINGSLKVEESNQIFLPDDSMSELEVKKESTQDDLVSRYKIFSANNFCIVDE